MVYLGADHAGFELKESIRRHLEDRGEPVEDLGAASYEADDDYPDYAFAVARRVAANKANRGIVVCDTGIGVAIAANKISGVRAALTSDEFSTKRARAHNDANVLALASETVSPREAVRLVDLFLGTPFSSEERHRRRLEKIEGAGS